MRQKKKTYLKAQNCSKITQTDSLHDLMFELIIHAKAWVLFEYSCFDQFPKLTLFLVVLSLLLHVRDDFCIWAGSLYIKCLKANSVL